MAGCNEVCPQAGGVIEKGFEFDMATPIVVSGKAHTIHHKSKGPVVIISLKADVGKAYIEFSFDD